MKTFKLENKSILQEIGKVFGLKEVRYNILTDNIAYTDVNGAEKRISVESLLKHLVAVEDQRELYEELKKIHSSYFNRRIKEVVEQIYADHNLTLPHNVFIYHGAIDFDTDRGTIRVTYHDHFEKIISEFEEKYEQAIWWTKHN